MESEYVKFACPHCKHHIEAPLEMAGTVVSCPSCNKKIVLPSRMPKTANTPVNQFQNIILPSASPTSNNPSGILITPKVLITAGVIIIAVILLSIGTTLLLHRQVSKTMPEMRSVDQAQITQSRIQNPEPQPQPRSVVPLRQAEPVTETQPKSPSVSEWERQNRDILIRMITDGHTYFADNQPIKALATYDTLFNLIEGNEIQDSSLRSLLAKARAEKDQINKDIKENQNQYNKKIQVKVSLALKNGQNITPFTQVFITNIDSKDAKLIDDFSYQFDEASKAFDSVPEITGYNFDTVKAALERRYNKIKQIIFLNSEIRKAAIDNRILSAKTDANGWAYFSQLEPGNYYLLALSGIGNEKIIWGFPIIKQELYQRFDLNNENARIIKAGDSAWDWL